MGTVFSMPNAPESPTLLMCAGKDCFQKCKPAFTHLAGVAGEIGVSVDTVECLGACSGPTAVVVRSDGTRCFDELAGAKVQRDICRFAAGRDDEPSKRLAKRELSGKRRKKAERRLAKQR